MKKLTRTDFNELTKEEKEAYLIALAENDMKCEHASHLASFHDDEKGIYILNADGSKEYVQFYDQE